MKGFLKTVGFLFLAGLLWSLASPSAPPLITKTDNVILNTGWQEIFAWFGMVPAIYALRRLTGWRLFLGAYLFGIVYFGISWYWINIAVVMFGNIPEAISVLIFSLLVLLFAVLWGIGLTVAIRAHQVFNYRLSTVLPIGFVATEIFRNYAPFEGYPWSNIAYSQYLNLPMLQTSAIWGIYGILFLIVLSNSLIVELVDWYKGGRKPTALPRAALVAFIGLMAFSYAYGVYRLKANLDAEEQAETFKAAMIQGNVDQEIKNQSSKHARAIIDVYRELSKQVPVYVELLIWPEAAYPFSIPRERNMFKGIFKEEFETLPWYWLTGASNYSNVKAGRRFYNSAYLMDRSMEVTEIFDKSHLVPFGEYMPMHDLLGFNQIVPEAGMFYPGQLGDGMQAGDLSFGTLICYEGIFPEITRAYAALNVQFLVNITNDAWYGVSSAPYQHLAFYAFRAAEARKALLRSANTGITAYIDSSGRIGKHLPLFTRGWMMAEVPKLTDRTIYSYIGDWPAFMMLFVWLGWFGALVRKRFQRKNRLKAAGRMHAKA